MIFDEKIASDFTAVDLAVRQVLDALKLKASLTDKSLLFKISFMLREMLNNGVEHGNHFSPHKWVSCRVWQTGHVLTFEVEDEGEGIDIDLSTDDYHSEDKLRERQRGYKTIQDMNFVVGIDGNRVTITLDLDQEADAWKN